MPLPLLLGLAAAAGIVKNEVEKSKIANANIEAAEKKCADEAKNYKPYKEETEFQEKMRKLMLKHSFSDTEKTEVPPFDYDWSHLTKGTHIFATKKHSMLSWGQYSFFTKNAVYYHNKRKGIHEVLYYDSINDFDVDTATIDYGKEHQNRSVAHWESFERKFIEQICRLWKVKDEKDTSSLEFCFNNCNEFKENLSYLKTDEIRNVFKSLCQRKGTPEVLKEYYTNLRIDKMESGRIVVQFWKYFRRPDRIYIGANDSEEEIEEKQARQEECEREAEEEIELAEEAYEELIEKEDTIKELFQTALFKLYGVWFEQENIIVLEEADFTYEGPSVVDRLTDFASSAQGFIDDYADKHNLNK